MLTFHNVDKRYRLRNGEKIILDHVNAHLPTRNIGILGGNGTGKSTLLRMISGSEGPNSGFIECDRRISFPLGFSASFNPTLSGIENTLFVSRIYGKNTEEVVEYVKEFSELGNQLYMPVKTYSSGMRARLAFGVSLAIDFELYLVDEITAVGDANFKKRSKQAFRDKLGKATLIMVSHGMNTLRDYCDAGVILKDGKLTFYDDLEEAILQHNENMGGDVPGAVPKKQGKKQGQNKGPNKGQNKQAGPGANRQQAQTGKTGSGGKARQGGNRGQPGPNRPGRGGQTGRQQQNRPPAVPDQSAPSMLTFPGQFPVPAKPTETAPRKPDTVPPPLPPNRRDQD